MKKFLFTMMAALLVCGMSFAQVALQRSQNEVAGMVNNDEQLRSGWVGQTATQYVAPLASGKFAAFAPRTVSPDMTGQITKVKIGVCNWEGYNKGQMRIGIYPVPTLTEDSQYTGGVYLDPTLGTEICGVDLDLTDAYPEEANYGNVAEVELPTALDIPDGDFWFVITAVDSICLLYKAGVGVENEMYYYADYTDEGYGWIFVNNSSSAGLCSLTLALYNEDGEVYDNPIDLHPFFGNTYPSPSEISSMELGETSDLVFYPFFENNGPETLPQDAVVSVVCYVTDGTTEYHFVEEEVEFESALGFDLPEGYYLRFTNDGKVTLPKAQLDELFPGATTLEVFLTVTSEDINDPDLDNNTAELLVTITRFNPVQNLVATPEGSNVVLTWDAPEAKALSGYFIFRDGTQIASRPAGNPTYTDANVPDGLYEYCVEAVYGTAHSEQVCVETTVDGINEMAENIAVYPNPANSFVKIANAEGAKISVINSLGQVVANINEATAEQEINVAGLANGIYTIRISNNDNVVTRQFNVNK